MQNLLDKMIEKYNEPIEADDLENVDGKKILLEINKDLQELKQSMQEQPSKVCKSCLGKKQVSVFVGDSVGAADFPGDKSYIVEKGGIKMINCKRCKGTGEEQPLESGEVKPVCKICRNGISYSPIAERHGKKCCICNNIIINKNIITPQEQPSNEDWIEKLVNHLAVIPEHTRLPYANKVIKRHIPPQTNPPQKETVEIKSKLLGKDTEDGITCEIYGYWKDGICYVTDCINKREGE